MQTTESPSTQVPHRFVAEAHQVVDKIASGASYAAETLAEKSLRLREAQLKLVGDFRSRVQKNPFAALGIVGGIAVGLGLLFHHIHEDR